MRVRIPYPVLFPEQGEHIGQSGLAAAHLTPVAGFDTSNRLLSCVSIVLLLGHAAESMNTGLGTKPSPLWLIRITPYASSLAASILLSE